MKATLAAVLLAALPLAPAFAQPQGRGPMPEFLRQDQRLMREGKLEDALALYRQTLKTSPNSIPANLAAGSVLDLMGKGTEARTYFTKAIGAAQTPEEKAAANRAMAMSYAFEANCAKTVEYEQRVFDIYSAQKNFYQQGEIADEAARVCIDSGDLDAASKWYKTGHDVGLEEPNISPERRDLWEFRWEHAEARLAARRGKAAEARRHVSSAKAILDKGRIPQQQTFFPYLAGYVDFYTGDYEAALEELKQANQRDPFIQCLIGETYEKLGDKAQAIEYYRKAAAATSHNPPAACAVPFARRKLS